MVEILQLGHLLHYRGRAAAVTSTQYGHSLHVYLKLHPSALCLLLTLHLRPLVPRESVYASTLSPIPCLVSRCGWQYLSRPCMSRHVHSASCLGPAQATPVEATGRQCADSTLQMHCLNALYAMQALLLAVSPLLTWVLPLWTASPLVCNLFSCQLGAERCDGVLDGCTWSCIMLATSSLCHKW